MPSINVLNPGGVNVVNSKVNFYPLVQGRSKQLEASHIYLVVVQVKLFIIV